LLPESAEAASPGPPRVALEITGGGLWWTDQGEGGTDRTGPGISGGATFRFGTRLALATDIAWIDAGKTWPDYSDETTAIGLSASLLWHFGRRGVQPYLGLGGELLKTDTCYDMTTDGFPPNCYSDSVATPVLQAGVKFVNRRGLVVAPEIRLEVINTSLRVGVNVGWARFKRASGR
jgi:hypothetical protein